MKETESTAEERNRLLEERDKVQREIDEQRAAMLVKEQEKARAEAELKKIREEQERAKKSKLNGSGDSKCFANSACP